MPKLEVEVNEKGEIGELPAELQSFFDKRLNAARGEGAKKAAEEAKKQIEDAVAKARKDSDPAAVEKVKSLERQLSKMREEQAISEGKYEEAKGEIEKRHAAELKDKADKAKAEITRRDERIRELATADIRIAAVKGGAREESLDALVKLLGDQIDIDEHFKTYVKDADDPKKPRLDKDQKPVSIEGLVNDYLTANPYFKAAPGGRGGRSTGGASLTGQSGAGNDKAAALDALTADPSIANAAAFIGKIRQSAAAR